MSNKQIRCLYIEDEDSIRGEGLRHLRLKFSDTEFIGAASFDEAIAAHEAQKKSTPFDFVVSDFILPGKDSQYGGRDFVASLRELGDDTPVAIYSRSRPALIKDRFREAAIEVPGNRTLVMEKSDIRLAEVVALMKRRFTQPTHPAEAIPAPLLGLQTKLDLKAG